MIHYHGTPMSGGNAITAKVLAGKHAMVSWATPAHIDICAEVCQSVTLDNGAFTAWMNKSAYNFDGYVEWATHWMRHPAVDWCLIPDVIDGSEKDNDHYVKSWPLHRAYSVPVWHLHESIERLARLVKVWPRVALGSSGEYSDPGNVKWWGRIAQAMEVACDADGMPKTKLHGLRMLDTTIFSHLPLSSADSTNVARNIGIDTRWNGPYAPKSRDVRAQILIDRIEAHAAARRWCHTNGLQEAFGNMELIG